MFTCVLNSHAVQFKSKAMRYINASGTIEVNQGANDSEQINGDKFLYVRYRSEIE